MATKMTNKNAVQKDQEVQDGQEAQGGSGAPSAPAVGTDDSLKKRLSKSDIIKLGGLVAFFLVMGYVVWMMWPMIGTLFQEGGVEKVTTQIREAGWQGVFILLLMQFLQIVVAFIPGEVTQIAAGMIYGPWWGALIIVVGCMISSSLIFLLVHGLGAPFVHDMVPEKYVSKIVSFEGSDKFRIIIFILFLIPGLPKDVFTYLVPLTHLRLGEFLGITTLGRIPGIVVSTYAASQLAQGEWVTSVILFVVLAAIALVGILNSDKIIAKMRRH